MFVEGDRVIYTGKNYTQKSRVGICVSGQYIIREWIYINVSFTGDSDWHPVNVENLEILK